MSRNFQESFLMLEETPSAARASWSAEGAALVAQSLRGSGRLRLRVHGESMLPALWPGEVVEIASCSPDDLLPGDIVLALRDGRLFLHRLLATCKSNGFLLRGDSMPGPDPKFPLTALLGRFVRRVGQDQGFEALSQPTWLSAKCSRAVGTLFCHFGLARRLALKVHSCWKAPARAWRIPEPVTDTSSRNLSLPEPGNL